MLVVLLVLTAGVSCSDDEELLAGNGIADAAWSAENQVEIEGGVLNYTFAAASDWTARSSADWCEVQTGSGMAGESLLRLKVAKNTRAEARSATITVSVWGYASPVSFVVKQGKGLIEQGDGKYRSVNEWVAEYMKSRYLWNRAIENVSLDYSLCYDFFFFSIRVLPARRMSVRVSICWMRPDSGTIISELWSWSSSPERRLRKPVSCAATSSRRSMARR